MEKNEFPEIILSKESYFFKIKPQTDISIVALGEMKIFLRHLNFFLFFLVRISQFINNYEHKTKKNLSKE